MNCDQAHELFSDYITGDLDPALRVKVENHLTESEPCRDALDEMRRIWSEMDQLPVVEPPARFHAELMARLASEIEAADIEEQRRPVLDLRSLFRPRAFALAATLLICALAGIEVVQTQRAALGPFGAIAHWIHPSATLLPHLKEASATWTPQSGASGTLLVRLRTDSSIDTHGDAGTFTVTLKRKLPGLSPAQEPIVATAKVSLGADEIRTVTLQLDAIPVASTTTLDVTATPAEGQPAQSLSVPLPTN